MSQSKTHNSILVLASLGVYLGLVFVGAAPQVLPHGALTRNFEITDEIEVKDDLDKKPDDLFSDRTRVDDRSDELSAAVAKTALPRLYISSGLGTDLSAGPLLFLDPHVTDNLLAECGRTYTIFHTVSILQPSPSSDSAVYKTVRRSLLGTQLPRASLDSFSA